MKNLLSVVVVLFIVTALKAQIPNSSFECWNSHVGPPAYEEPCGWATLDTNSYYGYPIFVYKTTDSEADSFAIEVRTVGYFNPFPPFTHVRDIGLARTGNDYQNGVTGFRDTIRHTMFSAWVKYLRQGPDSAEVKIKLYKWNPNLQQPDEVATAKFFVSYTDTNWHCRTAIFSYVFPYTTSGNPDTACVYISSTQDTNYENIIRVDNISYGNCITPVNEIVHQNSPQGSYPNPAYDVISFSSLPYGSDRIKIFEITGKVVAVEAVNSPLVKIDVKMLNPGIYFYGVFDQDNRIVYSGKFSVVR